MSLDVFEYNIIPKEKLPESWQVGSALEGLDAFLQQNWNLRQALYRDPEKESRQQFLGFDANRAISTKKYIGTVAYKGEQLNIFPRVFGTVKDDLCTENLSHKHLLRNLVKWIEYSNKFDYPFLSISSELDESNDLREFFITLYVSYINDVLSRSIYYQYVEMTDDCASIKGKFDIKDYIVRKIPNGQADKFSCTYSSFESDNLINRIIKYVCRRLLRLTSAKNQKKIRKILTKLNSVEDVKCTPADCEKIKLGKLNSKYSVILSMSKMFLLNNTTNYSLDMNESFCFLFPTDVLFECFIGGFIKSVVEEAGGKVSLQNSQSRLIDRIIYKDKISEPKFTLRRDILAKYNDKVYILDTKYKEISRFENNKNFAKSINDEVNSSDLYQVIAYASNEGLSDVYLLYPMYRFEEEELSFPVGVHVSKYGEINIHFVRIPFVFEEDELHTVEMIKRVISNVFDLAS